MKLFLVLCLVAPLAVFGGLVSQDSTHQIAASDVAPNESQLKCIKDAAKKSRDANPDLEWWFKKLERFTTRLQEKVKACKKIDDTDDRKKCLAELKKMAQFGTDQLDNVLPTDKKHVLQKLLAEYKKCMGTD